MAKKVWSPERNRRLIRMFESGMYATSEMADDLNVSIPTVYNHLRRMGLETTHLPRRHRAAVKFEFSEREKHLMTQLADDGHKITEIAATLNRTLGPTRRIFRELGLATSVTKPLKPGMRFGALTVTEPAPSVKTYKGHFESQSHVVCDCGSSKIVFNFALRNKNTTSCGCKIHLRSPDRDWIRKRCDLESGARVRGLEMLLTTEHVKYIGQLSCGYCDSPPMNQSKGRKHGRTTGLTVLVYNGIDRVDSKVGYVPGNVIPCCHICNRAKSNMTLSKFVQWLKRLGSNKTESEVRDLCLRVGKQLLLINSQA